MREGGVDGDLAEGRDVAPQERPAGGGEDDALDLVMAAAADRLVHGVVLGVDRKDLASMLPRGLGHQVARGDEDFLVRDADALAAEEGVVDGRNPGRADDRRDHGVRAGVRRDRARPLAAADDLGRVLGSEKLAKARLVGLVAEGDELRAVAADLFGEDLDVAPRGEGDDLQPVGEGVDDRESAAADGAGGAEDRDAAHARRV